MTLTRCRLHNLITLITVWPCKFSFASLIHSALRPRFLRLFWSVGPQLRWESVAFAMRRSGVRSSSAPPIKSKAYLSLVFPTAPNFTIFIQNFKNKASFRSDKRTSSLLIGPQLVTTKMQFMLENRLKMTMFYDDYDSSSKWGPALVLR